MPLIYPDYSEIEKPIPPGLHTMIIQAAEAKRSEKGTNYVSWLLLSRDGQYKIVYNTPSNGRGAEMFKRFIHAAGDEKYESGPYDTDKLKGAAIECEIIGETYEYQGRECVRSKVKAVKKVQPEQGDFASASDIPF